jgi:hypothetical protein
MSTYLAGSVVEDLRAAVAGVRETEDDPRIGWAWLKPEYRAASLRAFHGDGSALTVTDEGMPGLERVMKALLHDQRVTRYWRDEDVWSVILSLLSAAAAGRVSDLGAALDKIVKPKQVQVAAALANVTWDSAPASFGAMTLARIEKASDAREVAVELSLDPREEGTFVEHAGQLLNEFDSFVLATSSTPRQGELATDDFNRTFEDLVGLALMLSDDLGAHGVYFLRGATNRPGIRGVTLHRPALNELLAANGAGELGARMLTITGWSSGSSFRWYSADPLPLDRLLSAGQGTLIGELLTASDAIAQRIRVAARWYARAFWADAEDDAALAVSVALDSMLTGKEAVPGAVSKSRFALLERDPAVRARRFERYDAVYAVRSAIAHGGDATRRLNEIGGARSILEDAHWVARQLLELRKVSAPADEKQFRELWSAVQWGTVDWANRP